MGYRRGVQKGQQGLVSLAELGKGMNTVKARTQTAGKAEGTTRNSLCLGHNMQEMKQRCIEIVAGTRSYRVRLEGSAKVIWTLL
jgi:hypothetical protein